MPESTTDAKIAPRARRNKQEILCERLRMLALQLGPDARFPTVSELCQTLDVSIVTLDSALRTLEAQKVISRKRGVGIFVRSSLHTRSICLLCSSDHLGSGVSPFWEILIERAREQALSREDEFRLHITNPFDSVKSPLDDGLMTDIRAGRVHGVLGVGLSQEAADWVVAHHAPCVGFAGAGPWQVQVDYPELVRLGVDALAEQGCNRIGLWNPNWGAFIGMSKYMQSFRLALKQNNLPFFPDLIHPNVDALLAPRETLRLTDQEHGYRTAMEVFDTSGALRPDGIVITNDVTAQGALVAMRNLNVCVGSEVKIASHANRGSKVLLGYDHILTLIEVDPAKVVGKMFNLLETLIGGQDPASQVSLIKPGLRRPSAP